MDNEMIDLTAGDARLRQRLDTYAEMRLTPDLGTSSRIRARVLAVAHRQADLARADAGLTIVTAATERAAMPTRRRRSRWRRPIVALLAASLAAGAAAGSAFAARPGGSLYETRLWLETLALPHDPSARALAELDGLQDRLAEAAEAVRTGDSHGAAAALAAYESIMEQASLAAIAARDDVAVAVLQAGVGQNVEVLQALILALPDHAADAIQQAVQRAIDRSDRAIDRIEGRQPGPGNGPIVAPVGATAKPTKAPTARPTAKPTPRPTPKPADGGGPPGDQPGTNGQPGPTTEPGKPDKPAKPTPQHGSS
jgi:predicted RecA/RadA family phage recombinase